MNFTGSPRVAVTVNGSVPAPTLRWREGDTVTMRVANTLDEDASIHWHGILLPANMDGVPGLSFHGIRPGETYVYRFEVRQAGTYWYHSHSGFQEQLGLYGPLVIEPREPSPFKYDREHVVMLTDWTDESPSRVFAKLKKRSDYYNFNQRTVGDFFRDVRTHAGGFVGGYLTSVWLDPLKPERVNHMVGALVCLLATVLAIIASVVSTLRLVM